MQRSSVRLILRNYYFFFFAEKLEKSILWRSKNYLQWNYRRREVLILYRVNYPLLNTHYLSDVYILHNGLQTLVEMRSQTIKL